MPFCSAIFKVLAPTVLEFWSYGLLNFCFWGILNPNCGLSFAAIVFKLEHKEVLLRTSCKKIERSSSNRFRDIDDEGFSGVKG